MNNFFIRLEHALKDFGSGRYGKIPLYRYMHICTIAPSCINLLNFKNQHFMGRTKYIKFSIDPNLSRHYCSLSYIDLFQKFINLIEIGLCSRKE